ncbi:hypothetical protein HanIR_Chr16g0832101 [Helianthus annuus]|nr:hypothetical protein HanIR_Chr16g0832101 [Helianthus annuus]
MAVEVKVYCRKKKTPKKPNKLIIFPTSKCFQLPRSASASKPCSVFYLPICSFKSIVWILISFVG